MTGPAVVLMDRDADRSAQVYACFAADGVRVVPVEAAPAVTDLLATLRPQLIVLGLPTPCDLGVLCAQVRRWASMPILLLLDAQPNEAINALLAAGADDYLRWPFTAARLRTRVRELLRRVASSPVLEIGNGELSLHPQTLTVLVRGTSVALTPIECTLLLRLARQAGKVLTSVELLEGEDPLYVSAPSYLAAYVWHLRQKLERDPRRPQLLLTIEGAGYLLNRCQYVSFTS